MRLQPDNGLIFRIIPWATSRGRRCAAKQLQNRWRAPSRGAALPSRLAMTRLFLSFLTMAAACAQTNDSLVLIDPQLTLGNYTAAGFPVTDIRSYRPPTSCGLPYRFPCLPAGSISRFKAYAMGWKWPMFPASSPGGAGGGSQFETPTHADSWSAPFYAFNDLDNSIVTSTAAACDGNVVVGAASNGFNSSHAMMWTADSAKSQVDLPSALRPLRESATRMVIRQ